MYLSKSLEAHSVEESDQILELRVIRSMLLRLGSRQQHRGASNSCSQAGSKKKLPKP